MSYQSVSHFDRLCRVCGIQLPKTIAKIGACSDCVCYTPQQIKIKHWGFFRYEDQKKPKEITPQMMGIY